MRNSIRLPPGRIETKIPLPHTNCSLSLCSFNMEASGGHSTDVDCPSAVQAYRQMPDGDYESYSYSFSRQHQPHSQFNSTGLLLVAPIISLSTGRWYLMYAICVEALQR